VQTLPRDYTRKTVQKEYESLDAFLTKWNAADRKHAVIEELANRGVFLDELADELGNNLDAFDLICHVAFDQPPLTRRERVDRVQKRIVFAKYGDNVRAVLEALLDKFADGGVNSLEWLDILKVDPLPSLEHPSKLSNSSAARSIILPQFRNSKHSFIRK
jgi:type I restriction enzyme R subunit